MSENFDYVDFVSAFFDNLLPNNPHTAVFLSWVAVVVPVLLLIWMVPKMLMFITSSPTGVFILLVVLVIGGISTWNRWNGMWRSFWNTY